MYLSVGLLILFQVYWLQKEYENAHRRLQREVSVVLRENFLKRQMSLIFKDSNISGIDRMPTFVIDRRQASRWQEDSTAKGGSFHFSSEKTAADNKPEDSMHQREEGMHGPQRRGFRAFENIMDEPLGSNLIVRASISQSDLKVKNLAHSIFREALEKAGLPDKFTLAKSKEQPLAANIRLRDSNNVNIRIREDFQLVSMELDFGNAFPFVIQRIYGQVLISLVMTSIVIVAFWLMFRSLRQQQKLALLKNDFISNMTHELKTPVATVSVAIEALKNFNALQDPVRTKEYLDISSLELNRLTLLIDKVLRINMFEADKLDLNTEPVELNELTRSVIQTVGIQAEKTGAVIKYEEPAEPLWVKGDRLHLMSVLYNLLDNALKYHSENPVIEVKLSRNGNDHLMGVKDNGPGIATEYQPRIFEKFFRVPTGNRHDIKGYGLGLSYVSDIIQKHGGSISLESTVGSGCNFIVKIPALS